MDTTVSRTFNTIGTFPFICTVHPGMAGEIVVE
jgi:plastocyanin